MVGRYSGTMFTTLIRDAEDKAAVEKTVNHIKDRARARKMHLTSPIKLSAGIVYIPEKGRILTLLLKAAMEALPQLHSDNETTARIRTPAPKTGNVPAFFYSKRAHLTPSDFLC